MEISHLDLFQDLVLIKVFLKNKFSENIRAGEDIKWFEDNKLHINEHKISKTLISYHGFPKKLSLLLKNGLSIHLKMLNQKS